MSEDAPRDRRDETGAERDDRNLMELLQELRVAALGGLAAEGLAVCGAVLLIVSYVDRGVSVVIIPVAVFCLFAGLWFGLPLLRRGRAQSRVPSRGGADR